MASKPEATTRIGGPGHGERRSDVTDTSSKGLLPQLTDVLYALADSHELLLRKLQSVRLEHIGGEHLSIEETPGAYRLADAERRGPALVEVTVAPTTDANHASPTDEIEETARPTPTWLGSTEFDSSHGVTPGSVTGHTDTSVPSGSVTQADVLVPSHERDAAAATSQAPIPADPSTAHSDPPAAEPAERNYNFFDDLDVRLTSLTNPESESGEH